MNKILIAVLLLAVCACASHTGVVVMGKDTYMIAKQQATGFPGLGNMKAEIIAEGTRYCASLDKKIQIISEQETQPPYVLGNYPRAEIQFMCIADDDTELQRQTTPKELKYRRIFYTMGIFPTPKYYDLDKKVSRMVVVSPSYQEGNKRHLQDMLVQTLWNIPNVQIIEREQIKTILHEQKLGVSGIVSPETAIELGKISGADHIFTYFLETCKNNEETYQSRKVWGKVKARIYNTKTGEIVYLCRSDASAHGVYPNYIKKFFYPYTQGAIIMAYWGFKASIDLAFGKSALGLIYEPPGPKNPQIGPQVSKFFVYSPAFNAGLKPLDVILEADGQKVSDQLHLTKIVQQHDASQPMKIKILRSNVEKVLTVHFR